MRILHVISGSVYDGASRGAIYLHKYLLELGVDSKILFNSIDNQMPSNITDIYYYKKNYYEKLIYYSYKIIFKIIYNLFFREKVIFTTGFYGVNIRKNKLFKDADIIHLHSINDFISLNTIQNIHKPVVWSLRDWWLMLGGYHLPNSNKNYNNKHGMERKITSFLFQIKKKIVMANKNNIYITAISKTIKKDFEQTFKKKINYIYNLTDQENFYPEETDEIRDNLNIKTTKKIILFGAQRISDPSKGSQYLENVLSKLDYKQFFIISFGINDTIDLSKYKFEHINFGEINDNNILRKLYSISNLFLCTSIHESFGKTVLESLLCDTPVVAFNIGAVNEIIVHRKNGFLAKPFNVDDFVSGIYSILDMKKNCKGDKMRKKRFKYLEKFSYKIIPQLHLDQYNKIIKNLYT